MEVGWYISVSIFLSFVGSTAMVFCIHLIPELHAHPMGLVMAASAFESALFFSVLISPHTCELKLPNFFQWTLRWTIEFNSPEWEGEVGLYRATQILNGSTNFFVALFWYNALY